MKVNSLIKYSFRFLFLQGILTFITIYYFDNFLIPNVDLSASLEGWTFRDQIDANLFEDRLRFYPFIPIEYIKIDYVLGLFIFSFLIFLYSTKFYTYVNELSFS